MHLKLNDIFTCKDFGLQNKAPTRDQWCFHPYQPGAATGLFWVQIDIWAQFFAKYFGYQGPDSRIIPTEEAGKVGNRQQWYPAGLCSFTRASSDGL